MHISLRGDTLILSQVSRSELPVVRALPSRRWDQGSLTWQAPYTQENWDHLAKAHQIDTAAMPRPTKSGYRLETYDRDPSLLVVRVPASPDNIAKCRAIPEYRTFNGQLGAWVCKLTPDNVAYLRKAFPQMRATAAAVQAVQGLPPVVVDDTPAPDYLNQLLAPTAPLAKTQVTRGPVDVEGDFKFKTRPYLHQLEAFQRSRELEAFALFMQQGTGKSWVTVLTAAYLATKGQVDRVLVVCPNAMKEPWREEFATHCPDYVPYDLHVYRATATARHRDALKAFLERPADGVLRVLVVNVEGLSTEKGQSIAAHFLRQGPTLMVVDESSRIKSPGAKRTKAVWKMGKLARFRRILTGTPMTQSPLDLYAQFKFLGEDLLGFSSFYAFRNRYALLGGWNGKEIKGYVNTDELREKIEPHSYRVLRQDCLDLPAKVYQKLVVDLTAEQRKVYDELKSGMLADLGDGRTVTTQIVITQLLRLQQVVGGFVRLDPVLCEPCREAFAYGGELCPACQAKLKEPEVAAIPGANPKLEALQDVLEEHEETGGGKTIVWCRFRPEIQAVADALRAQYGPDSVVEFHGGVDEATRSVYRQRFQDPTSKVRFFVGQTQTGGVGITLTAADLVVYFSNDFSLEARLQSEDRAHRIGQDKTVTYVDLVAADTIDAKVIAALRAKQNLANLITRDTVQDWL